VIKTKTTFIVGAGASHAYGLPLGIHLRNQAVSTDMLPSGDLYQLLHYGLSFSVDLLNEWRDDLSRYPGGSIDEFLFNRQERADFQSVGKAVIAGQMARAINGLPKPSPNWIEIVVDRMAAGAANLDQFIRGNTGVEFVTFNFDSLIQQRIGANLARRFVTDSTEDALAHIIPVHHVHGRLPPAPTGNFGVDTIRGPKPDWVEWLKAASASVRVVYEPVEDSHLEAIRTVISRSDVVVCLGWAYHPENLRKLKISEILNSGAKSVFGSAYNVDGTSRDWIAKQFNRNITLDPGDCQTVLRDFPWYQD